MPREGGRAAGTRATARFTLPGTAPLRSSGTVTVLQSPVGRSVQGAAEADTGSRTSRRRDHHEGCREAHQPVVNTILPNFPPPANWS